MKKMYRNLFASDTKYEVFLYNTNISKYTGVKKL